MTVPMTHEPFTETLSSTAIEARIIFSFKRL